MRLMKLVIASCILIVSLPSFADAIYLYVNSGMDFSQLVKKYGDQVVFVNIKATDGKSISGEPGYISLHALNNQMVEQLSIPKGQMSLFNYTTQFPHAFAVTYSISSNSTQQKFYTCSAQFTALKPFDINIDYQMSLGEHSCTVQQQ